MVRTAIRAVDAKETLEKARFASAQALNAGITHFAARLDSYVTKRRAKRRARAIADAEAKARRIRQILDSLPSQDDPATHHPTGGLSPVGPTEARFPAPETEVDTARARDGNGFLPDPDDPTATVLQKV
jgi:hypothetical protein